jgi:hypothetical protein
VLLGQRHQPSRQSQSAVFGHRRDLQHVQIEVLPGTEKVGDHRPARIHQQPVEPAGRQNFGDKELRRPWIGETDELGLGQDPGVAELWRPNRKAIAHFTPCRLVAR